MIDAVGPLNFLEAIRRIRPHCRFYQASTSELYGDTTESPQNELTRFKPASPYAVAKLAAHNSVDLYRRAYGLYACCGILFNHESPRRGELFVTRKITRLRRPARQGDSGRHINSQSSSSGISMRGEIGVMPGIMSRRCG